MPENKPRRLNEVVPSLAPEGANDRRWFLLEYQMEEAKLIVEAMIGTLEEIIALPENENEREVADDCQLIVRSMRANILGHRATFLSYLSDTDVPERISRKEL